ncbi:conserved hypothetical protein [Vibrio crassostreae]|uniref:hypothetical protein n=1 Tax=Vibrio crassostreae TaxID=246167 RepID=UPI000FB9F8E9|nr:hypothetical protein [Vibrio crassostreae]ROR16006.1 hypothetical protein EDB36_104123 [Vibrio crassostreae]CAK2076441.1 conserved hypothetical protein [Vibrio crassostreae]CAK2344417.1 conserved hypothetical protein [Vibrio crassostreae]CAK2355347.1 conserved hypothetical protein [Vibrio crassostreae]CAK3410977.1 conserved hypothetical protein [Vibrio crassostreae]
MDKEEQLEKSQILSKTNIRQKEHIIRMMYKHDYITNKNEITIDSPDLIEKIEEAIKIKYKSSDIDSVITRFLNNMIDENFMKLLSFDRIFCIFCYLHLSNNDIFNTNERYIFFKRGGAMQEILRLKSFSKLSKMRTVKDMENDIIYFLNTIECNSSDKNSYLNYLEEKYYSSKNKHSFSWLDKKEYNIDAWSINYLTENETIKRHCKNIPELVNINESFRITVPAIFHSIEIGESDKTLFLINMKKAWSQKKHRIKIKKEKKKSLNIIVDESTVEQLKQLSQEFDQPVNQIVSMMASRWVSNIEKVKEAIKKEKQKKIESFDRFK